MVPCPHCEHTPRIKLSSGSQGLLSRHLRHTDLEAKRSEQQGNSPSDVWSNLYLEPFLNHVVLGEKKNQEKWNGADTSIFSFPFTKTDTPKITQLKGPESYIFPSNRNSPPWPHAPAHPPLLTGFTQSSSEPPPAQQNTHPSWCLS